MLQHTANDRAHPREDVTIELEKRPTSREGSCLQDDAIFGCSSRSSASDVACGYAPGEARRASFAVMGQPASMNLNAWVRGEGSSGRMVTNDVYQALTSNPGAWQTFTRTLVRFACLGHQLTCINDLDHTQAMTTALTKDSQAGKLPAVKGSPRAFDVTSSAASYRDGNLGACFTNRFDFKNSNINTHDEIESIALQT